MQSSSVSDGLHSSSPISKQSFPARSRARHGICLKSPTGLKAKGADLCIPNLGDTGTATGRLFTFIGTIACFEHELMLERQREGIANAKAQGKYKGRKPTARARAAEVNALRADGVRPVEIARRLGIGRASVYR